MRFILSILIIFSISFTQDLSEIVWEVAIEKAEHKKILDVPVYTQSSKAPDDGWCGHTSLQMILDYYGDSYTQEEINSANNESDSPTIFFHDMVPVIEKLTNKLIS